ncbi:hypothetical protein D3C81_1549560 [compost metagenome]
MDGGQYIERKIEHRTRLRWCQSYCAADQVELAHDQVMVQYVCQQLLDLALAGQGFEHQLDGAATGQAETESFFRTDAVGQQFRRCAVTPGIAHTRHQVVLDATAGD